MNIQPNPQTINQDEPAMSLGSVIHRMRQRKADPVQIAHLSERLGTMQPGPIISTHWPLSEAEG